MLNMHPKENDAALLSRNAVASKGAGNDTFDQKTLGGFGNRQQRASDRYEAIFICLKTFEITRIL